MSLEFEPNGRGSVVVMKTWTDLQLAQARARGEALANEAGAERLAKGSVQLAGQGPTLRMRVEGAIAGWKQPGKVVAA